MLSIRTTRFRSAAARALAAILIVALGGGSLRTAFAENPTPREDVLKAAYLFNFVKFVEWPAAPASDALTVCFLGGDRRITTRWPRASSPSGWARGDSS